MIFGACYFDSIFVQSGDAVIPVDGTPDGTHSRVCELDNKVKDLERKVAKLFMDNIALITQLKAGREVKRRQQEENTSLNERLLQALWAQVNIPKFATLLLNTLMVFTACPPVYTTGNCYSRAVTVKGRKIASGVQDKVTGSREN